MNSAANKAIVKGIFLDINGNIGLSEINFQGRLFGGDSSNLQFVSGANLTAALAPLIGRGLRVLLAGGAVLFGAKLSEHSKKRRPLAPAIPYAAS